MFVPVHPTTAQAVVGCMGKPATIVGTAGADDITGTLHNDVIVGGGGDDAIRGLYGRDLICAGPGDDDLVGGLGRDRLAGGRGDDDVRGGGDPDRLSGGVGADRLRGGGSADLLKGGPGSDRLNGGAGRDVSSHLSSDIGVIADLADGLVTDGADVDQLAEIEGIFGSRHADVLRGDDSANVLVGDSGDDRISGAGGPDTVEGGGGDDTLDGDQGADGVSFRRSPRRIRASLVSQSASGDGRDTMSGFENLTGSPFGDRLVGDGGSNRLAGGGGSDRLLAEGEMDFLLGGAGDDFFDGGGGRDWVLYFGAPRPVNVVLSPGGATGQGRDDLVRVETAAGSPMDGDRLTGGQGSQTLIGGPGRDFLRGGGGPDSLSGGVMKDELRGGPDADSCEQTGEDTLIGCDEFTHGDGAPQGVITRPRLRSRLRAEAFPGLAGHVTQGGRVRVRVALRRSDAEGCRWFDSAQGSLRRGACDRPLWTRRWAAPRWSYPTRTGLPDGHYVALVRAVEGDRSELGRNRIAFRLT